MSLFKAIEKNNLDLVVACLAQSIDLSKKDAYGFTALHKAIMGDTSGNSYFDIVKLLVAAGADVNQLADDGRTPIFLAAEFCTDIDVIKYLLAQGADPKIHDAFDHNIVENAWSEDIKQFLSEITGFPVPVPPPPPKYKNKKISKLGWKNISRELENAFNQLQQKNIVALQNIGYTQSDAIADVLEYADKHQSEKDYLGYCFYTEQDKERALSSGSLFLSYDRLQPNVNSTEIAQTILETLESFGFELEYSGNIDEKIHIWLQPFVKK